MPARTRGDPGSQATQSSAMALCLDTETGGLLGGGHPVNVVSLWDTRAGSASSFRRADGATGASPLVRALDACRARCGDEAFAPVCAANGAATYANKCWANCAFASGLLGSGARVNFVVDGACANPTRFRNPSFACATACAQVYEPVCGENGVSYSNGCIAECSGVRYVRGSCHA